jgi:hypothetical protein
MSVGPHNPFFQTPYGDIGGKNVGGRPKKVKTTFAPLTTAKGGFTMPDIEPDVMKNAEDLMKAGQLPPGIAPRPRALQISRNKKTSIAMTKSENVRNSR